MTQDKFVCPNQLLEQGLHAATRHTRQHATADAKFAEPTAQSQMGDAEQQAFQEQMELIQACINEAALSDREPVEE